MSVGGGGFFALLCLLMALPCRAVPGPLIIILLPGTRLSDWRTASAPNLHQLMETGALAVMNTRTARTASDCVRESPESAVLTLSAGARAAGGTEVTRFFPVDAVVPEAGVSASALYARRIGATPAKGALVNPDWPRVLRENQERGYDLQPGSVGDALRASQVRVLVGGGRFSLAVGVDRWGQVLPALNGGGQALAPQTCVVWDAGSDPAAADSLIGQFAAQTRAGHGRLILLSPFASDTDYATGRRLTPVLEWGEGVPAGLLFSHSTRRAGLVTNTDFAPSVLSWFSPVRDASGFGRAWEPNPSPNAVATVARLEASAYRQAQAMRILPYLAVLLGGVMALGTILAATGRRPRVLFLLPGALLLALLLGSSPGSVALWLLAVGAVFFVIARRFGEQGTVLAGCGLLLAILLSDLLSGDPLMRRSLLGYSAVEGARYYGIGNESMGVLVGAALIVVAGLWSKAPRAGRIGLLGVLAFVTALLGAPFAGAKAGGLLVSLPAFGALAWGLSERRLNGRVAALLLAGTVLAMAAAANLDARRGGQSSHIGQAYRRIQTQGWGEAEDIIARKLGVEGRLLFHSTWACPLWIGLAGFGWRRKAQPENQALRTSGLTALATCLAFNDAGTVAAALCVSLLWGQRMADTRKGPRQET